MKGPGVWNMIGEYTGLAVMLPAAGLIGYGIGWALDQHWHSTPVFTVIFLFLGCIAGLIEIVRVAARRSD
ncbi:MAG: AtpZ/AtpI family protein [Terriglobales bacterium]